MRRNRSVISLGHARNQTHFGDPTGVTEVGLQDRRRAFFENLAESPFGKVAFARGNGDMSGLRKLSHKVHILAIDYLLIKERLELFQLFHEYFSSRGWNRSMKIDADVSVLADDFSQPAELSNSVFNPGLVL